MLIRDKIMRQAAAPYTKNVKRSADIEIICHSRQSTLRGIIVEFVHADRARNWEHLLRLLYDGSWNERLQRHRSPFVYRGLASTRFDLRHSLGRLKGQHEPEAALLRNFIKYSSADMVFPTNWHWLAVAQHHGLPTRLLDWTYSPLVALHFVTDSPETFDEDGVVWCVNIRKARGLLPPELSMELLEERADVFSAHQIQSYAADLAELDHKSANRQYVLFFEPPSIDQRIVNQFALFSLMPGAHTSLESLLLSNPDLYRKIIVPKRLKWEIRDKLDQAGINERVIYPGPDGLSKWLKRYYTSRPAEEDARRSRKGSPQSK